MQPTNLALSIPIIAIVMGLGTGMLSLYLSYRKRKDMFLLYHQERMAAIEKGIDLPPMPEDFFHETGQPSRRSPHRAFLLGLILLSVGLTLYLALHFTGTHTDNGSDAGLYALIPAGIGAAYLIYYFTVGRKLAAVMEEERKSKLAQPTQTRNTPE